MQKDSPNPWKVLSTKLVYKNPWIKVHEDSVVKPDGSKGIYGYVELKDSVLIVAMNDRREIYLVPGFSYPVKEWHWQLVGGGNADGEDMARTSRRELNEETGITAKKMTKLGVTRISNGLLTERMTTYLAQDLIMNPRPAADDVDFIKDGQFFSLKEIHTMIENGDIDDGQTLTGLYLTEQWLATQR